ncbi:hypothetical protein ARMGADRAFT_1040861 [Armillaria gallica]|uniref:Uncharacterized protein n=1 Tax=Armillaria gallica TaxID=47427 RepID=A0A2H3CBW9_ARMGA|nr:hypothetical protein ARMGADRAFT_1040861 [Armillaria gallica]
MFGDPGWVKMGFSYVYCNLSEGKSLVPKITVAHSAHGRTQIQTPFKSIWMTAVPMGQDPVLYMGQGDYEELLCPMPTLDNKKLYGNTSSMSLSQPGPSQPRHPDPSPIAINPLTCIGMEMGYVHSPMARILKEYSTERDEDDHSTCYRVQYYSNFDLTSDNILDLGFDQFTDRQCYSLQPPLVEAVVSTIMGLQSALLSTASLLTEREVIFQVDPKQMFMNILHGTNNVHLLYTA